MEVPLTLGAHRARQFQVMARKPTVAPAASSLSHCHCTTFGFWASDYLHLTQMPTLLSLQPRPIVQVLLTPAFYFLLNFLRSRPTFPFPKSSCPVISYLLRNQSPVVKALTPSHLVKEYFPGPPTKVCSKVGYQVPCCSCTTLFCDEILFDCKDDLGRPWRQAPQTCLRETRSWPPQLSSTHTEQHCHQQLLNGRSLGLRALGTRLCWAPALRELMVLQGRQIYVNWCIHLLGLL